MGTMQFEPRTGLGERGRLPHGHLQPGSRALRHGQRARLPFSGASANETMNGILHAQPEAIARFNYNVPPELERIVRKCLEKDRERRYQSARELLVHLRNLKRESDSLVAAAEHKNPASEAFASTALVASGLAILIEAAVALYPRIGTRAAIDSLAVLPFVNLSGDPNTEYLKHGIAESLIIGLSRLPNLNVISLSSVLRTRERDRPAVSRSRPGCPGGVDGKARSARR